MRSTVVENGDADAVKIYKPTVDDCRGDDVNEGKEARSGADGGNTT